MIYHYCKTIHIQSIATSSSFITGNIVSEFTQLVVHSLSLCSKSCMLESVV